MPEAPGPDFWALHEGLARQGPGLEAATLRALGMTGLAGPVEVLDLGAGTGAQSLVLLAALPEALVTAVDAHPAFVADMTARVEAAGFAARFTAVKGDMAAPPVAPGTVDLLWCEGAIYVLGVEAALRAWRPLLSRRGAVVFSDLVWTTPEPSEAARAFFAAYPGMTNVPGVLARIAAAGYASGGGFMLAEGAWDAYYGPLAEREKALRAAGGDTPALAAARAEMALRERHREEYGCAMFLARPRR